MQTKPSRKILRKLGLSDDQEGIIRRYINESGSWDKHLHNTKKFIEQCVLLENPKDIGVLGSGWLLDVPIGFLINQCNNIFLYDIRHPRQIVNKYKNNKNVHFKEVDITGGAIEFVYQLIRNNTVNEKLLDIPTVGFSPEESLDYIVSVNVLNQLDILIVENLRKIPNLSKELIAEFRKIIQSSHIKSLPAGKSCLITDFEEQIYDRTDKFVENHNLLYTELPEGKKEQEWIWNFDTLMTYYPNRKTDFKVIAKQF